MTLNKISLECKLETFGRYIFDYAFCKSRYSEFLDLVRNIEPEYITDPKVFECRASHCGERVSLPDDFVFVRKVQHGGIYTNEYEIEGNYIVLPYSGVFSVFYTFMPESEVPGDVLLDLRPEFFRALIYFTVYRFLLMNHGDEHLVETYSKMYGDALSMASDSFRKGKSGYKRLAKMGFV